MREKIKNHLFVVLGFLFVALGGIGIILPILPTTPFLIVALAFFAKGSPRFHKMLLNNPWFGSALKQWEENKTLPKKIKRKAYITIIITFTISIIVLHKKIELQLLLVAIAVILLFFIRRIKEEPSKNKRSDKG